MSMVGVREAGDEVSNEPHTAAIIAARPVRLLSSRPFES
jgi:hypothetical protein